MQVYLTSSEVTSVRIPVCSVLNSLAFGFLWIPNAYFSKASYITIFMKYTCKGKVIIKSRHITSSMKYLQFLFQYFPSSNSTEDDESYFQNQNFLFATCAAHLTVLPTDQHSHNLMSDNKTPLKPQTKAVLGALYCQEYQRSGWSSPRMT